MRTLDNAICCGRNLSVRRVKEEDLKDTSRKQEVIDGIGRF